VLHFDEKNFLITNFKVKYRDSGEVASSSLYPNGFGDLAAY
jgi:hypothetical protein